LSGLLPLGEHVPPALIRSRDLSQELRGPERVSALAVADHAALIEIALQRVHLRQAASLDSELVLTGMRPVLAQFVEAALACRL
jgi:hypothetical protein